MRLRDALSGWLDDVTAPAPAPLTPADVRAIVDQHLAEILPLRQSPQARYEDAVAARLCTIPGCPAFPGAAQHFEHGDPEPHDVGHPEPADPLFAPGAREYYRQVLGLDEPADVTAPKLTTGLRRRHSPDVPAGTAEDWENELQRTHCTGCGHPWASHEYGDGCKAILGKARCGCVRTRPTGTP
jgi:hypothetical protein